jgi:hypothetical protein
MKYTTQTLSEKWTTEKGSKIELTATVETYDYEWKIEYDLVINGTIAEAYDINSENVLTCKIGYQKAGVVVSKEIKSKINAMIETASKELAERTAEYNAIEAELRKSNRGY